MKKQKIRNAIFWIIVILLFFMVILAYLKIGNFVIEAGLISGLTITLLQKCFEWIEK